MTLTKAQEGEGGMMDAKELGNQPAYPVPPGCGFCHGLTKREAFAMAAPQKDIEDVIPNTVGECAIFLGVSNDAYFKDTAGSYFRVVARLRFKWADAMLAELAKGE